MTHSTRPILYIWIGAAATLAFALGTTGPSAARARLDAEHAQNSLRDATGHARVIAALRTQSTDAPQDDPSRGGLTPRVTAALQRAGLATGALASLSPEAETVVATHDGVRVMRRRATLSLSGVTLPQVGKFLDAWRSAEPAWTPVSIDLSPVGGKPPEAGGDLPLRAAIAVEAFTLHHDGGQR
ncbi:MAG: hypothetical protein KF859_11035 [Phycisphaeraceae bacterium]|nr:hypothetical protein [Phycisphaeraceae bacterium]